MSYSPNTKPSRKYVDYNEITDLIRGKTNNNVLRAVCKSVCHLFFLVRAMERRMKMHLTLFGILHFVFS